jgi:hypothetical protein
MNETDNDIINIQINLTRCLETYPCKHYAVVTYKNGTTKERLLSAHKIIDILQKINKEIP